MLNKKLLWASLTACGLILSTARVSVAMPTHSPEHTQEFRSIEQPLELKVGVTIGGLALIGLELWWFLFSKAPTQRKES
jgi:plastocyanin domain-containing protein